VNQQNINLRRAILDTLVVFAPTHHIPLQFDTNHKPKNIEMLEKYARVVIGRWERVLLGQRWYRKHIPFIMIAEKNESVGWHAHILLKDFIHDYETLRWGFLAAKKLSGDPVSDWKIIEIDRMPGHLCEYVMKHVFPDRSGRIDTRVWIPSEVLFDLPKKRK